MFKRILVGVGVLSLVAGGLWLTVGPEMMASVSHMTYRTPHYSYEVHSATYAEEGIVVSIEPERSAENASAFAGVYLQTSHERAERWVADHRADPIDVMVIFRHPLTLEEANEVLRSANANVFESGVVGYTGEMPFAAYSKVEGPLLTRSLQEHAESVGHPPIEEMAENSTLQATTAFVDVRGYLAVRAWVDSKGLDVLLKHEDVRVVDITTQEVRDQLSNNRHWRNKPIDSVAIEMPVWAYEW
ncbi:MAG TPA: hypothetical protein EYP19_12415 [Desulfobacterales bacterium]|nr:hypothetical protein [Desulfobacterales bacterium]